MATEKILVSVLDLLFKDIDRYGRRYLLRITFLFLVYFAPITCAVCSWNSECSSSCCLRNFTSHLYPRGKCRDKLTEGDPCLPNQNPQIILGRHFFVRSCPCQPGLHCIPKFVRNKDQTYIVFNPTCKQPPLTLSPPTTEPTTTPQPTLKPTPTMPCASQGPLVVNLSLSIGLP